MAKILYEVKQNQNSYSAAFGKWYAQIKNLETLNTRKLANHISFYCTLENQKKGALKKEETWKTVI